MTVVPTGIIDVRTVGQTLNARYSYSDADGDLQGASPQQWRADWRGERGLHPVSTATLTSAAVSVAPVAQTGTPKEGAPATSPVLKVIVNTNGYRPTDSKSRSLADADSFCRAQGQRLPMVADLQELYLSATTATSIDNGATSIW